MDSAVEITVFKEILRRFLAEIWKCYFLHLAFQTSNKSSPDGSAPEGVWPAMSVCVHQLKQTLWNYGPFPPYHQSALREDIGPMMGSGGMSQPGFVPTAVVFLVGDIYGPDGIKHNNPVYCVAKALSRLQKVVMHDQISASQAALRHYNQPHPQERLLGAVNHRNGPSAPGNVLVILPTFHRNGGRSMDLSNTRAPSCTFLVAVLHLDRWWSWLM